MRNSLKIQNSIIALVLCLMVPLSGFGAEWATVVVDRAKIYSDIEMTSAIGYIKKGKRVRVGEKARNKGRVLPIIVSKRVAYIRVDSIQTNVNLGALEGAGRRIRDAEGRNKKETRFSLYGATLPSRISYKTSPTANNNYAMIFLGGGFRGSMSLPSDDYGYRGGFEYLIGSRGDERISIFSLSGDYFYKLIRTGPYDLNVFGGLSIVPFSEYKLKDKFTLNGAGVGAQVGGEMVFKLYRYSLHLEGAYQYFNLWGYRLPELSNYPDEIELSAHGVRLSAALSMKF